jgi:hypothetical protein
MIASLFTVLGCFVLIALTQRWWRSYLNPVSLGVLAWMPALVMLNWPQFFVSPRYIQLNRDLSFLVIIAMGLGFLSFWAGCATAKALSPPGAFEIQRERLRLHVDPLRLLVLFGIGLAVFLYAYLNSGLLDLAELDEAQVAESRLALNLGGVGMLMLLMDIAAIGFYARFLQTGRWLYSAPLVVALLAYGATLQKSPVVGLLTAVIFVSALHPRAFYTLMLRRVHTQLLLAFVAIATIVGLAQINTARGITESTMTAARSPFIEQLYIYSGATAIQNLSVTLEGYLPSDGPTFGIYLIRPILWDLVDREIFASSRYFEGINAATYLNVAWVDFRWAGFVITPFLTGVLVMLFIRFALSGSLAGLVFGAIAARAVVFTIGTDVMFEPVTWYTLLLALAADYASKDRRAAREARRMVRRPNPPPAREALPPPRTFPERSPTA